MKKKSISPPISDYGLIGDCHSAALVSKTGSIDWCCMPTMASPSCFGRISDWEKGGYCQITPTEHFVSYHQYYKKTMILETHFKTKTAHVKVIDFFPMCEGGREAPYQQMIRVIKNIKGSMKLSLQVVPLFDYGTTTPWIRPYRNKAYIALGGNNGLLISSNIALINQKHTLEQEFEINDKQRFYLSILYRKPQDLDADLIDIPIIKEINERLKYTIRWWSRWLKQGNFSKVYLPNEVKRSALILKCLSYASTGAIAAAPTTSLPEEIGGKKNWDYRYSWIRDSFFTVVALERIGFIKETERFKKFVGWSTAGNVDELQILYGIDGHRKLSEFCLKDLSGYEHSKPVRIGNQASEQVQFDTYGELLSLAWRTHLKKQSIDPYNWEFLKDIVNLAIKNWHKPDRSIWEFRINSRHFVFSKVMCWVAVSIGIKLGEKFNLEAPYTRWYKALKEIRSAIEKKGYDKKRGVFVQSFDYPIMDSSLLLLPVFEFIDHNDERMIRTTNAIIHDLVQDNLLRRYPRATDGLGGNEGVFLPCTFWLVNNLVHQRRCDEAFSFFKAGLSKANDLGLFSEEYDTKNQLMIGNFPQALTHLSFIAAALMLNNTDRPLIL